MPGSKLNAKELYRIANGFYVTHNKLMLDLIQHLDEYSSEKRAKIEAEMTRLREAGDSFTQRAKASLVMDVQMPTRELLDSIDAANEKIKHLEVAGKVVDVIAGIVQIAGTLLAAAGNLGTLGELPKQVGDLATDVAAL